MSQNNNHLLIKEINKWQIYKVDSINEPVLLIKMYSNKVNVMNFQFIDELDQVLNFIKKKPYDKYGIVLTSKTTKAFSAGLDLNFMLSNTGAKLLSYLTKIEQILLKLFTLKRKIIMAINGHAIAGGFFLACCGDKRFTFNNPKMKCGLNEVKNGFILPIVPLKIVEYAIGFQNTKKTILSGEIRPIIQQSYGFIDKIFKTEQEMINAAIEDASLSTSSSLAYGNIKNTLQENTINYLKNNPNKTKRLLHQHFQSSKL